MPFLHLPVQSGVGPHPGGHEPQAHGRRIHRCRRAGARRAAGHRACRATFIVGFPGETEQDVRGDHRPRSRRSVSPRPTRSSTARARERLPQSAVGQIPEEVKTERLLRLQAVLEEPAGRLQLSAASAAMVPVLFERAGAASRRICRPFALSATRPCCRCRAIWSAASAT